MPLTSNATARMFAVSGSMRVAVALSLMVLWVGARAGNPVSPDAPTTAPVAVDQAALAAAGAALAREKTCMACHQVDSRRVGPPLASIAKRYAVQDGRQAAIDYLAQSIRKGGHGRWGAVPMPAQPHVSEADAQRLAQWILSLSAQGR